MAGGKRWKSCAKFVLAECLETAIGSYRLALVEYGITSFIRRDMVLPQYLPRYERIYFYM